MTDAFKATDFAIRDLRITFSESDTVAWYSCYLDDHGEWNGQPGGWDNARWTGVVEKRNGKSVTVQMHFSFAKDWSYETHCDPQRGLRAGGHTF